MHTTVHRILFDDAIAWSAVKSSLYVPVYDEHKNNTSLETLIVYPFHYCSINGKVYKMHNHIADGNYYTVWLVPE